MARQWGAKDKTKRVRRTKKQIAEDRKQQVSEHIRKIREEEQERISKKYYLLPKRPFRYVWNVLWRTSMFFKSKYYG